MEFMKKEKEDRALERELDKKELREMISLGVKKEVEASIEPMKEKQVQLEKEQEVIKNQFSDVLNEMKEIKTQLQNGSTAQFTGFSGPQGDQLAHSGGTGGRGEGVAGQDGDQQGRLRQIISKARRTVGLQRIDSGDLIRMRQAQFGGAQSEDEEKLLAVHEFLKCELKLSKETINSMDIESIFAPARQNPQCLYVTFIHGSSLTRIFERVRCMRKESRILNFIPAEYEDRYTDIRDIEYNLRQEEDCQTRIKMGFNDLELSKKIRGSGKWQRVPLPPGIARVDLTRTELLAENQGHGGGRDYTPLDFSSMSPAPGRPGKRGRESTGSPTGQTQKKAARDDIGEREVVDNKVRKKNGENGWKKAIEEANLVTESQITPTKDTEGLVKMADTGIITSISGTPSQKTIKSPIITKNSRIPSLRN